CCDDLVAGRHRDGGREGKRLGASRKSRRRESVESEEGLAFLAVTIGFEEFDAEWISGVSRIGRDVIDNGKLSASGGYGSNHREVLQVVRPGVGVLRWSQVVGCHAVIIEVNPDSAVVMHVVGQNRIARAAEYDDSLPAIEGDDVAEVGVRPAD